MPYQFNHRLSLTTIPFTVINLALCAVDVARQHNIIDGKDDLSIHPSCNVVGGNGSEFLLECVPDVLTMIVKRFDSGLQFYSKRSKRGSQ